MMERRQIEGTPIALERQTERTPTAGKYYLFQGDQVIGAYEDETAALGAYRRIRHEVWLGWLSSGDPKLRLIAARGLCQHEPESENREAVAVLWRQGTERDRIAVRTGLARLERLRRRAAAAEEERESASNATEAPSALSTTGSR